MLRVVGGCLRLDGSLLKGLLRDVIVDLIEGLVFSAIGAEVVAQVDSFFFVY